MHPVRCVDSCVSRQLQFPEPAPRFGTLLGDRRTPRGQRGFVGWEAISLEGSRLKGVQVRVTGPRSCDWEREGTESRGSPGNHLLQTSSTVRTTLVGRAGGIRP